MNKSMDYTKVKKNTILNIVKTISTILFPMVIFMYASHVLGADGLGKIKFSNSIINYILLISTLGIGTYAIRECSKVKNDKIQFASLVSRLYMINIITTAIAYIILFFVMCFFSKLADYKDIIVVQSGIVIFTTLGAEWLNMALEDYKYITIRTFISQLIAIIAVFIFVREPNDYLKFAAITMITSSGAYITNIYYRKRYVKIQLPIKIDVKKHLPPILFLFSMTLAQSIYVNVDSTMLGLMRSDFEVGLYASAVNIYNVINQVVASVAYVVMPSMAVLFSHKNYTEINKMLSYSFGFIIVLGLPCVTGAFTLSKEILYIMGGPEYIEASLSLRILCIALLGSFFAGFVGNIIMLPSGREKLCLCSSLVSAAVNFIMNIFLIPRYGIAAASITTAIAQWIGLFVKYPFIEKDIRLIGVKKNVITSLIGCFFIVIVVYINKCIIKNTTICLLATVLISVVVYFCILLLLKNQLAVDVYNSVVRKERNQNV
ncbi:MAG: oligosaccharide flippase family protein [Lachnospiraceae bacterium]|nr:oligosaccharide flippase family protein [Lachnospiraceae bacterium]